MIDISELKCVDSNIDVDKYISFREYVKEHMEYPDWLGDFTKEDIIDMLNNNSKIWIYYLDDKEVCSMMLIPSDQDSLDKFNIDKDVKEVVDYGPMFVHPDYWGNGLQYQMLKELDKYSLSLGYKYAAGTIHPDNKYSINNLLKDGFKYIGHREFKRGERNIYFKEL